MTVSVHRATLNDLSYIASGLRPDDRREVDCQFEAWDAIGLAVIALRGLAYTVHVDGNPEAAFGANPTPNPGLWIAWSFGTRRMWKCAPVITQHVREVLIPMVMENGAWRAEARCLDDNKSAQRWLVRLGARRQGLLKNYGKNGEDFALYEWTRPEVGDAVARPST